MQGNAEVQGYSEAESTTGLPLWLSTQLSLEREEKAEEYKLNTDQEKLRWIKTKQ